MRLSLRDFAGQLGVTDRAISKWEAGRADKVPRPDSQAILDTKLRQVSDEVRTRFELILSASLAEVTQESATVIGARLKIARVERGWTARKMAEKLRAAADNPDEIPHIDPGLIRMLRSWEKGDHRPSEIYRLLYCKVFGVGEAELFGVGESSAGEMLADGEPTEISSEYPVSLRSSQREIVSAYPTQSSVSDPGSFAGDASGEEEDAEEEFSAPVTPLQAARREKGWSQGRTVWEITNLAAKKKMTVASARSLKTQLSRWENGHVTPEYYRPLLRELFGLTKNELVLAPTNILSAEIRPKSDISFDPEGMADRISELVEWAEATNIGDGTLSYLDSATLRLAHDCLTVSPLQTGERADVLVRRIHEILRSGRQRLGQTRDLYVIAGKLCAILSWISSDLGQLAAADAHARNGWTLADQADHDGLRALLLSAQSKIDFLRRRYDDAAMHARRGHEYDPPGTLRVLLACQEADALQAMGRIKDAMETLIRSERTQDDVNGSDELVGGIFGCGIARQSNYSIATYLRSGSIDQALLHVDRAETAWRNGEEWAYGTWAQVQIGAAIAHLMNGDIDGSAMILRQILDQPAEKRLATLASRLRREVTPMLASPAIEQSKLAITLREGIADYDQSPIRQLPVGGEL
jgi:transcriptional regulator with XRE-family HTH domain